MTYCCEASLNQISSICHLKENKMSTDQNTPFQKAIDAVESLPFGDREELLEIIRLRIAAQRRDEIAYNAKATLQSVRENRAKFGTIEDLKKDLLGD
jgi:hypothetical protein